MLDRVQPVIAQPPLFAGEIACLGKADGVERAETHIAGAAPVCIPEYPRSAAVATNLQIEATAIVKKTGFSCLEERRDLQRREFSVHDLVPIVQPMATLCVLVDRYGNVKTVGACIFNGFLRGEYILVGFSVDGGYRKQSIIVVYINMIETTMK